MKTEALTVRTETTDGKEVVETHVEDVIVSTEDVPVAESNASDEDWQPKADDTRVTNIKTATTYADVYIGRPSKWGNPYSHEANSKAKWKVDTREEAVAKYAEYLSTQVSRGNIKVHELASLYGRSLGCYCAPEPCHGDVLAKAASWAIQQLMSAHSASQVALLAESKAKDGNPIKLAVVGSRNWQDRERVFEVLDTIREANPKLHIVSGGANGADGLGKEYAETHGLEYTEFEPDWDLHGKKAGFVRNQQIWSNAHAGVAFWDGKSRGTKHSFELYQGKPFHLVVDPKACISQRQVDFTQRIDSLKAALGFSL